MVTSHHEEVGDYVLFFFSGRNWRLEMRTGHTRHLRPLAVDHLSAMS